MDDFKRLFKSHESELDEHRDTVLLEFKHHLYNYPKLAEQLHADSTNVNVFNVLWEMLRLALQFCRSYMTRCPNPANDPYETAQPSILPLTGTALTALGGLGLLAGSRGTRGTASKAAAASGLTLLAAHLVVKRSKLCKDNKPGWNLLYAGSWVVVFIMRITDAQELCENQHSRLAKLVIHLSHGVAMMLRGLHDSINNMDMTRDNDRDSQPQVDMFYNKDVKKWLFSDATNALLRLTPPNIYMEIQHPQYAAQQSRSPPLFGAAL